MSEWRRTIVEFDADDSGDTDNRVQLVIARLSPLEWRESAYYRGAIRCCNDTGRLTCTLLPGHDGPHRATDCLGSPSWK